MTHNPVMDRAERDRPARYFMPEDDKSTLYVFDVDTR